MIKSKVYDILIIGWLCFYFFKNVKLFPWWIFIILFIIGFILEEIGEGIANRIKQKHTREK